MTLLVYVMVTRNNSINNKNESFLWSVLHSFFLEYARINRKKVLK